MPEAVVPWWKRLNRMVEAGVSNTFLLHLNVFDHVPHVRREDGGVEYHPLNHFLRMVTFTNRNLVICYDRSSGITFPGLPEESLAANALFRRLVGDITSAGKKDLFPTSPAAVLPLLERVLTMSKEDWKARAGDNMVPNSVAVVVNFAETVTPAGSLTQMSDEDRTNVVTVARWAQHPAIVEKGAVIVLVAVNAADIAPAVRNLHADVVPIKLPLPSFDELATYITSLHQNNDPRLAGIHFEEGLTTEQVAHAAAGLTLRAVEHMARIAVAEEKPIGLDMIYAEKGRLIEALSGGVLSVQQPKLTFDDIGGLHEVKEYLMRIAKAFRQHQIISIPEGLLLMGPPGTAKSVLGEAFAHAAGIPLVVMKLVRSMWVGESERNLELALELIDALAPVIVIRDEAEAEDSKRGSGEKDGGVGSRLQRRELVYFSDPRRRGRVLVFRISNRPDLMDAAVLRPGRSDGRIPVLPTMRDLSAIATCLMEIISRELTRTNSEITWQITGDMVATVWKKRWPMVTPTGAELRSLLCLAGDIASQRMSTSVNENDLVAAVGDFLPTRDQDAYDYMAFLALKYTTLLHLIPEEWSDKVEDVVLTRMIDEKREALKKRGGTPVLN